MYYHFSHRYCYFSHRYYRGNYRQDCTQPSKRTVRGNCQGHQEYSLSLTQIQEQLDSLAGVVLQNQRASNLLTTRQEGAWAYLKGKGCFYVNRSGQVSISTQSVLKTTDWVEDPGLGNFTGNWQLWLLSILLPLVFPLILLFILLLGPPLWNHLV